MKRFLTMLAFHSLTMLFLSACYGEAYLSGFVVRRRFAMCKASSDYEVSDSMNDFEDVSDLWSMEDDEDDEVWPGATDEAQRLKLLEPRTQENEAAALLKLAETKSQLSPRGNNDSEDVSDLWSMEDDEDDEVWPGATDEAQLLKLLEQQTRDEQAAAAAHEVKRLKLLEQQTRENEAAALLKLAETNPQLSPRKNNDSEDMSDLWSTEDEEDDEVWPGATNEAQRLKLLEQKTRDEQAAALPKLAETKPKLPRTRRVQRQPDFWSLRLESLRQYKTEHGHVDVPYRYEIEVKGEAVKLGSFLHYLRALFERETLQSTAPFEFVKELTELGMKWRFLGKGRRHQLFLQRLNEWRDANRGGRMDPILRTWMWRQRYQYVRRCEGLPSFLTPDRIDALVDAGIIPFQRPLQALQDSWDEAWNNNLKEWTNLNVKGETHVMSHTLTLWAWEQWRMYDILRGEVPYKGDLPVLLTGSRVKSLQDVAFFESERPVSNLGPPDVENSDLSIEWSDLVDTIKAYFFDHGNFDIQPSCQASVFGESLYSITSRLKREYKWIQSGRGCEGKSMVLNDERTKELDELMFFQTEENDPVQSEFEWWEQYHEFKKGRRDFLIGHKQADFISRWIEAQQKCVNSLLGDGGSGINEAHYEALRNLGVVFDFPGEREPAVGQSAHGNVVGRPPSVVKLNEDILRKDGSLPRKQNDMLEDLTWQLRYGELRDFVILKGHSFVSKSVNPKLALWANNQRQQYQKAMRGTETPLNEQRIQLLKDIDFDFGVHHTLLKDGEGRQAMIQALQRFQNMHGHCFVPVSLPSNPKLGDWVNQQRQAYRRQELSRQHIRELKEIGLDLDMEDADYFRHAFDALWDDRVDELQSFYQQHGHCDLGIDQTSLSSWAEEQRQFYRLRQEHRVSSHLTQGRIDQLDELGFKWVLD